MSPRWISHQHLETYFMCKCFMTEGFLEETNSRVICAGQGKKRVKWDDFR